MCWNEYREIRFYVDLADRIPLQVPTVLGTSAGASASWLCLSAEWPAPPVETWPEHWYLEVARQLGRFHATFWNSTQELSGLPWLRTHEWYPIPAVIQQASASWQTLAAQPGYQRVLTLDVIGWIETMVRAVDGPDPALQSLPLTLCHGDCHHGNLLINAAGEWVWADWQEVGIGRGPEDLSFFLQRARMAGGRVPEEVAIQRITRAWKLFWARASALPR